MPDLCVGFLSGGISKALELDSPKGPVRLPANRTQEFIPSTMSADEAAAGSRLPGHF
jgi:hypothetical protein